MEKMQQQKLRQQKLAHLLDQIEEERQKNREVQQAYNELASVSRIKSKFISQLSHDIRTPLNAIVGMTTVAAHHIDDKERVMESLNDIVLSSQHILSLVDEVMDICHLENWKSHLGKKPFCITEVFVQVTQMISGMLEEHGHQLITDFSQIKHETVYGNRNHLIQVLMNLIGNSIKYTPDGGKIRMRLQENEDFSDELAHFEVEIEDSGVGMSEEFISHIFEPFVRDKACPLSGVSGTGLGMTIAQDLVHMMNGNIVVESQRGVGTCFYVTLALPIELEKNE